MSVKGVIHESSWSQAERVELQMIRMGSVQEPWGGPETEQICRPWPGVGYNGLQ